MIRSAINGAANHFFVFLLSFAFFSPLGHARYDIIAARGQQSQYRHRIASKTRSTRYLLYVAYTPRVASTVRLVLKCTYILRARTSTSNLFCSCFLLTYEISTDGLSLIYLVVVYNFLLSSMLYHIQEQHFPCSSGSDISHVLLVEQAHSLRDSFCLFAYCPINSQSVFCIPVQQYEYESDLLFR